MKYARILGLLAMAAAALMVFVGPASATTVTSPAGTTLGVGAKIHASSEGTTTLDGPATISCEVSTVEGEITNAGGTKKPNEETVSGTISKLTFEKCNQHVTVVQNGTLIVHTEYVTVIDNEGKENEEKTWVPNANATGNGTLTSSGAEVSVNITALGLTCVYSTNATDIGTLTGSKNVVSKIDKEGEVGEEKTLGGTATLDIASSPIPRTGGSIFCGSSAKWTGSYKVNTPDYLDVD